MNKKIIIICLILKSSLYSQFYDINLSYEHNDLSIKDEHKYILEEFNNRILNYIKFTKYSPEYDFLDIPLNINIIYHSINLIDESTYDGFTCQILLSNNADQYFITKNIFIPYYKGRDIYYNPMQFDDIASIFDYFAYVFIANELDTYGKYLGEEYYNNALEISNLGSEKNNAKLWNANKKLIETILENNNLRNAKYYFFNVLDILDSDKKDIINIKNSLSLLLENLQIVYEKYGYEKHTLKFIQAYNLEICDLFKILDMDEGINFLIKFDYKNSPLYEEFLND